MALPTMLVVSATSWMARLSLLSAFARCLAALRAALLAGPPRCVCPMTARIPGMLPACWRFTLGL